MSSWAHARCRVHPGFATPPAHPLAQRPHVQQALNHVTGVTETRLASGWLTTRLQEVNLICAIAPPPEMLHTRSHRPDPDPPTPLIYSPVGHRSTPGRGRRSTSGDPAPGTKKIALDPAESSAIDDAPLSLELGRGPRWGGTLVVWSCGAERLPRWGTWGYARRICGCQASLRCCGMPASSARTSASR